MSGPEFAIVADDLTGAADSCANLAKTGRRAAVFFEAGSGGDGFEAVAFEAVAFDTDSRCAQPDEARRRVLEAGGNARLATIVYKKIDSTLRGNVAVEIGAMMEATGRERAVVAPAFPHAGRATVGGGQLVYGTPVHETELARDPKTPVRESHLPTILSGLGSVGRLTLDDLADTDAVRRSVEENRCVVADATEDSHLRSLVRAVPEPSRVLWVGSAGLASALSSIARPGNGLPAPPPLYSSGGGVLAVVGSLSEVSRRQLRHLERSGKSVPVPIEDASGLYDAKGLLRSGGCVALHSPSGAGAFSPGEVAGMLAEAAAGLEGSFGSLVMTGGDTALAVARRLGAKGIAVFGEVELGVPHGALLGPSPYRVVTKAGGFGHPGTLCDAVEYLSGMSSSGVAEGSVGR